LSRQLGLAHSWHTEVCVEAILDCLGNGPWRVMAALPSERDYEYKAQASGSILHLHVKFFHSAFRCILSLVGYFSIYVFVLSGAADEVR